MYEHVNRYRYIHNSTQRALLLGSSGESLYGIGLAPTSLHHGWETLREEEAQAEASLPPSLKRHR